jgi:hypothetical protein
MKLAKSSLVPLLLAGSLAARGAAMGGEDGILLKDELTADSYCHLTFPAVSERTLAGNHPVLSHDDIIDFYGPCDENPLGQDQVQDQRKENLDQRSRPD